MMVKCNDTGGLDDLLPEPETGAPPMTDFIEFDPVDDIAAGAFGRPGERTFVIQARKGSAVLSVLVEKEQVGCSRSRPSSSSTASPPTSPKRCRVRWRSAAAR